MVGHTWLARVESRNIVRGRIQQTEHCGLSLPSDAVVGNVASDEPILYVQWIAVLRRNLAFVFLDNPPSPSGPGPVTTRKLVLRVFLPK